MTIIIIVAVILVGLFVASVLGVFEKPKPCVICGKMIKGISLQKMKERTEEQVKNGEPDESWNLCTDCFWKIPDLLQEAAKMHWTPNDYQAFLKWDEETREERSSLFTPTVKYGEVQVDTSKDLFRIRTQVFRFDDVREYEFSSSYEYYESDDRVKGLVDTLWVRFNSPDAGFIKDINNRTSTNLMGLTLEFGEGKYDALKQAFAECMTRAYDRRKGKA